MPITEPSGNMIIDIGGGTTDIAVISLAGIVYSKAVRVAGNGWTRPSFNASRRRNLLVGERTAERIKIEMDRPSAHEPMTMEIRAGIDRRRAEAITVSDARSATRWPRQSA